MAEPNRAGGETMASRPLATRTTSTSSGIRRSATTTRTAPRHTRPPSAYRTGVATEGMKAIVVESFGGPEVLRLVDREPPAAGPGEVVLEVRAVNVNRADVLMRTGKYHGSKPPPLSLGLGAAGVVHQVGPGAT